jgi:hypothetical protein
MSTRLRLVLALFLSTLILVAFHLVVRPPTAEELAAQNKIEAAEKAAQDKRRAVDLLTDLERRAEAARLIRATGYDCQKADMVERTTFSASHTLTVMCNGGYYTYRIEDRGGRWSVRPE